MEFLDGLEHRHREWRGCARTRRRMAFARLQHQVTGVRSIAFRPPSRPVPSASPWRYGIAGTMLHGSTGYPLHLLPAPRVQSYCVCVHGSARRHARRAPSSLGLAPPRHRTWSPVIGPAHATRSLTLSTTRKVSCEQSYSCRSRATTVVHPARVSAALRVPCLPLLHRAQPRIEP